MRTMSYQYDGWTVNKGNIAVYIFNDRSMSANFDEVFIDDAVLWLYTEMEHHKQGSSLNPDKTNVHLIKAIEYRAACLAIKAGAGGGETSGIIKSESLEGKSVSYGDPSATTREDRRFPRPARDYCTMASDTVARWAEMQIAANKGVGISTHNYREHIFSKDRFPDRYGWGSRYG